MMNDLSEHHDLLVGILRETISEPGKRQDLTNLCEEKSAEDVQKWVSFDTNTSDEYDISIGEKNYDIEFFEPSNEILITYSNDYGRNNIISKFSYEELADFIFKNYKEIFGVTEQKGPPAIPENTAVPETFNYAVLSAELGDYLKRKEQQLKNEYMNFTANCGAIFAEAQERLAGKNQHDGLFEKWIESMGFKKDTVYRMINIHKFCSSQIATSKDQELFDSLSKSLQYEIAKPSAPAELVDKVMSGDITTHKEYIALKKELDNARLLADSFKRNFEMTQQSSSENFRKLNEEREKNSQLEKQIKELESRPTDIAVIEPDPASIEKKAQEIAAGRTKALREENEDLQNKLDEVREELKQATPHFRRTPQTAWTMT